MADCINDTGYLVEFSNVDFHQLPKSKHKGGINLYIIRLNHDNTEGQAESTKPDNETPHEVTPDKSEGDECSQLKTQVQDLTREIDQMKATMTEKMKQQVDRGNNH